MLVKLLPLFLSGLLIACATSPEFDTSNVDKSMTPQRVIAEPDTNHGKLVLWGGTILDIHNLKETTQLEVLAYPLNTYQRPLLDLKPLGRFIIESDGYLEPANFAQGRLLTVLGSVSKMQSGKIGESSYDYPVISATQLHLWSQRDDSNRTSFSFGVGVGL